MRSPSITDWIQTVVVVVGITAALWEFVLHDRDLEKQRKQFVFNLIVAGFDASHSESNKEFFEVYTGKKKINKDNALDVLLKLIPLQTYYDSWGYCYNTMLCDRQLTIDYICGDVIKFNEVKKIVFNEFADSYNLDKDQIDLIIDCKKIIN